MSASTDPVLADAFWSLCARIEDAADDPAALAGLRDTVNRTTLDADDADELLGRIDTYTGDGIEANDPTELGLPGAPIVAANAVPELDEVDDDSDLHGGEPGQ